jgi:hypothetical protein
MTIPFNYHVPAADKIDEEDLIITCIISGIWKKETQEYEVAILHTTFPLISFTDLVNHNATSVKIESAAKKFYNNQFNNANPLDLTLQQIEDLVIAEQNIIEHKN